MQLNNEINKKRARIKKHSVEKKEHKIEEKN
jgi:hypothetical protein